MPTYELTLLLKILPKVTTAGILKRTANSIFDKGGIIRRIDNLGSRPLPYKTSQHGAVHREASYFMFEFDVPPSSLRVLQGELNRDVDLIRNRIYRVEDEADFECTFEEEMLPPPYRPEVVKMMDAVKRLQEKAQRKKFSYNTGLDYYPFQK